MGYSRWITGSAEVKPPLDDKTLAKIQADNNMHEDLLLDYFTVEDAGDPDTVALVNGEITVIPGTKTSMIGLGIEERMNHSDFEEMCAVLAKAVHRAGSVIEGSFTIYGEDDPDISRVRFDGKGGTIDERPKLLWPNGDQEAI